MSLEVKNACVLLVEDHRDLAETTLDFLSGVGFETDYAGDGISALQLACSNRYDAIILDVMLPNKSGFDILRDLRLRGQTCPKVLMQFH